MPREDSPASLGNRPLPQEEKVTRTLWEVQEPEAPVVKEPKAAVKLSVEIGEPGLLQLREVSIATEGVWAGVS